eukprot:6492111-Amphidinium_carterae.1
MNSGLLFTQPATLKLQCSCPCCKPFYLECLLSKSMGGADKRARSVWKSGPVEPLSKAQKAAGKAKAKPKAAGKTLHNASSSSSTPHQWKGTLCLGFLHILEDAKWGLYAENTIEALVALGDKCLHCYSTWKACFSGMTWEQLCGLYHDVPSFVDVWKGAQQRQAEKKGPLPGPAVCVEKGLELEVCKRYIAASDKDLRDKLDCSRVGKGLLKGLQSVQLPSESGSGSEQYWLFDHPDGNLKELLVKQKLDVKHVTTLLAPDAKWSQDHDTWAFDHLCTSQGVSAHCETYLLSWLMLLLGPCKCLVLHVYCSEERTGLLEHHLARHQGVNFKDLVAPDLDKWAAQCKQATLELGEPELQQALPMVVSDDLKLVGPATEHASEWKNLFGRAASNSALNVDCETPDTKGTRDTPESKLGQAACDGVSQSGYLEMDFDDDNTQGQCKQKTCVGCATCTGDEAILKSWTITRLPLKVVLQNKYENGKKLDGRTITGLQAAAERYDAGNEKKMLAAALSNHLKLVKIAQRLAKADLSRLPSDELEQSLSLLEKEGTVDLPDDMCVQLLRRRTEELMSTGQAKSVLEVMDVFASPTAFQNKLLVLSGLKQTLAWKLQRFVNLIFENLLDEQLKKGAEGAQQARELAKHAVALWGSIPVMDLYEMSDTLPAIHEEHMTIWRSILSLTSTGFDIGLDPLHDDVTALIAAKNRAMRSPLSLVSSTMHAQAWWRNQLDSWVQEAPGLAELAPTVQGFTTTLASFTRWNLENLKHLQEMASKAVEIKQVFKESRVAPFFSDLLAAATTAGNEVLKGTTFTAHDKNAGLGMLQRIVSDLCMAFPMNADIQQCQAEIGKALRSFSVEENIVKCKHAAESLQAMAGDKDTQMGMLLSAIDTMYQVTATLTPAETQKLGNTKLYSTTWSILLKFVVEHLCVDGNSLEKSMHDKVFYMLTKWPASMGFGTEQEKTMLAGVLSAIDLTPKVADLKPSSNMAIADVVAADPKYEKLISLRRVQLKIESHVEAIAGLVEPDNDFMALWGKVLQKKGVAAHLVEDVSGHVVTQTTQSLESAYGKLRDVQHGKKDGKSWYQDLGETPTWQAIKDAWAAESLFDVAPETLIEDCDGLQKDNIEKMGLQQTCTTAKKCIQTNPSFVFQHSSHDVCKVLRNGKTTTPLWHKWPQVREGMTWQMR